MKRQPKRRLGQADPQDQLIGDIVGNFNLETDRMPEPRLLKMEARREFRRLDQHEQLLQVIPKPPEPGVSMHVIGTGLYDFWTFVPQMIQWVGGRADELYCSTWTMNRNNVVELFTLWDDGRINPHAVTFLTGEYFKRRETSVYAYLVEGLRQRGGRFRAFMNHAKVLMLKHENSGTFLVCEGSANLTANPRLEQYVLTNDRALYDFHRNWMEEMVTT